MCLFSRSHVASTVVRGDTRQTARGRDLGSRLLRLGPRFVSACARVH